MKRFLAFSILLAAILTSIVSCGETKEVDDRANWKQRNSEFISRIASQCGDLTPETAQEGDMFKLLNYSLDPEKQWGDQSYVYCKVLQKSADTLSPLYTDSVRINYRLRLIPTDNYPEGQVMDRSFMTPDLDPDINIPSSFMVSSMIDGVGTAVMHMHRGDYWLLYIPSGMGYGKNGKSTIPGYSALVFEINLTEIAPIGQNLSPR
jgi:FKBP-type peptidyl-prolyl cis-trans isomerase FklB